MKIIQASPDHEYERMYCPSTNEVLFSPGNEELNENAEAFIASWHSQLLEEPEIKDQELKTSWEKFFDAWNEAEDDLDLWEAVEKFFREYENDSWVVYECSYYGIACGPVSFTVYLVVKSDTVIEEDPDLIEDLDDAEDEIE